ncbi:GNAT family N-acetyltransferase [Frigoribacterium sp. VKM Ac-2530]|uniref:GNAT family N-acetyltransferase n=1 Tax=Frigoribacterium sp. VKM Ac-2530 TaxID=2783822 RepID=UPI00188BE6F4|nr:GNAT family N-acetyltransferase [Frigoribacterium sp. VKM Ac-2530]
MTSGTVDVLDWTVREGRPDDVDALADLKLAALEPDLRRAGVWRPPHNRARFEREFVPAETRVVEAEGGLLGCLAVHPEGDDVWLRHFYLAEEARGRGIGTRLLTDALASVGPRPVLLDVLTGSRAAGLYLRHGFVAVEDDGVDVIMRRDARAESDASGALGGQVDVAAQTRTDSAGSTVS